MNKKKIIILVLASITVISLIYIFSMTTKKTSVTDKLPPEPEITEHYTGEYVLTLSVAEDQFKFPTKLPLFEISTSGVLLTEEYAKTIALSMNFMGDPTIIDDTIDGTTYFWRNDNAVLFAYAKSGKIRYSSNTFSQGVNKQLSDVTISSIAQDFIINNKIFTESLFKIGSIKHLKQIKYGEGFQETNGDDAVLFQASVLPKTSDFEFITTASVEPTSYIQFKQDGSVYSFQITLTPTLQKSANEYRLKTYDELTSSLNKATLIELREDTQFLSDIPSGTIRSIDVNKIEIAYLIESSTPTSFQPVYKLSGKAIINSSTEEYQATLYLPAFSSNQP